MSTSFDRGASWPARPILKLADVERTPENRISQPSGKLQRRAALLGTGSYLPERVLTNADLAAIVDTTDDWIVARTGIRERRIAAPDETTSTMAIQAARLACQDARLDPRDLDLVIVATLTPDYLLPATACIVQHAIGAKRAGAFDIEAACSGFLFASSIAQGQIAAGMCQHVLVVGAETLSRFTDYADRSTCILFGDGAGAAVYGARSDGTGILHSSMAANGEHLELLYMPAGGSRLPASDATVAARQHYIRVAGRQIAKFATKIFIDLVEEAMAACQLSRDDVDLIVPHQVNQRIIDAALRRLGLPREKCFINIDRYGNTSAASVPIALDEARRQGRLKPGQTAIMIGFGAGLTWGATVVKI